MAVVESTTAKPIKKRKAEIKLGGGGKSTSPEKDYRIVVKPTNWTKTLGFSRSISQLIFGSLWGGLCADADVERPFRLETASIKALNPWSCLLSNVCKLDRSEP